MYVLENDLTHGCSSNFSNISWYSWYTSYHAKNIIVASVEDNATMSSIRYFENHA